MTQNFTLPVVGIFIEDTFTIVPVLHENKRRAVILHEAKIYDAVPTGTFLTSGVAYPLYRLSHNISIDLSEV